MATAYYRYRVTVVAPRARGEQVHQAWVFWMMAPDAKAARKAMEDQCTWKITSRHQVRVDLIEDRERKLGVVHEDNCLAEMSPEAFAQMKAETKKRT